MASFMKNSYPFMLAFIFLSQLLASSSVLAARSLEDPEAVPLQVALPPESRGVLQYLEACASRISDNCWYLGPIFPGDPCYKELLAAGPACRRAFMAVDWASLREADSKEVLNKSNKI